MANKVKFVLNRAGVAELMKSAEMVSILNEYASSAVSKLGNGFGSSTHIGKTRANVQVKAETPHAYFSNRKHNSILKAVFSK